jgi:hypothetical protein
MVQEANEVQKTEEALRTSIFVLSSPAGFIQREYALLDDTDTNFPNVVLIIHPYAWATRDLEEYISYSETETRAN